MADKITRIIREDNVDTTVNCWCISYEVEDAGVKNSFCITVKADEMTNDTSEAEAKTLANAKASTKKSDWVTAKASAVSIGSDTSPDETVTL